MEASPTSASTKPSRGAARQALLDAALSLVRKQGWAATSVDQLCKASGVTKGAFFHHFTSKDELGVEAARHWSDVTAPLFASAGYHGCADPLDRIFGYLDFRATIAHGPLEAITAGPGSSDRFLLRLSGSVFRLFDRFAFCPRQSSYPTAV